MAKTNAAGEPSFIDARGTDQTAVSATDREYYLDPTASVNEDGVLADNKDLVIEGEEAERFETREEREQREQREREEGARRRTEETLDDAKAHEHESGDYDPAKGSQADAAKHASFEKSNTDTARDADTSGQGGKEVTSSAGTSSKGSSKPTNKTSANS